MIVGNATPGATLTVSRPPAAPAPDSVSYRWRLDGESIRGANRSELTMRSDWRSHDITVSVTVEKAGYVAKTVTSAGARVGGAAHGVYVLGDHLERGVYSTSGPSVGGESCRYTFYTGFYGSESADIGGGSVTGATTITMPENAVGFETRYCSWKRIG